MTRHAKNVTAGNVYTTHERKKDARESGYGSTAVRLGKDSIKEFDCCCLTLQPCHNPMVTADGYLYDKEAILEYVIHQKRDITKKLKEYERQKTKQRKEAEELAKEEKNVLLKTFVEKQGAASKDEAAAGPSTASKSKTVASCDKHLPSFWIPSLTPQSKATALKKPDETIRCPMSGKPLKIKDLIPVNFTLAKDGDKRSLIAKDVRYVCAVTNDILSNSVPCAVLKTSGSVVTMECVEKIIKKDMVDPINRKKLTDKDIVPLERGATGFAGAGIKLEAKVEGPAMQA
jgi:nitric oxide synthase-interacting protein